MPTVTPIPRPGRQPGEASITCDVPRWARSPRAAGSIWEARLERLANVISSGILLICSAPLFLVTAAAIWLDDPGPVMYRQTRVGLLGKYFELLKFRSMRINNLPIDDVTEIEEGHPMVTRVGRWLRRFKIDELPQLINVLRGEMSLVGPRPVVPEHLQNYDALRHRRFEVRPGMTGWAQVNGSLELPWRERIMLDVWYVDHRSARLDLTILWRTLSVVIFGEWVNPHALEEAQTYAYHLGWRD